MANVKAENSHNRTKYIVNSNLLKNVRKCFKNGAKFSVTQ